MFHLLLSKYHVAAPFVCSETSSLQRYIWYIILNCFLCAAFIWMECCTGKHSPAILANIIIHFVVPGPVFSMSLTEVGFSNLINVNDLSRALQLAEIMPSWQNLHFHLWRWPLFDNQVFTHSKPAGQNNAAKEPFLWFHLPLCTGDWRAPMHPIGAARIASFEFNTELWSAAQLADACTGLWSATWFLSIINTLAEKLSNLRSYFAIANWTRMRLGKI